VRPYIAKKKNNFVHFLLFKSEKSGTGQERERWEESLWKENKIDWTG